MLVLTNLTLLENLVEASVHAGCVCAGDWVLSWQRFDGNWELV
jgi:hypothetical protein